MPTKTTLAIASDHGALELKNALVTYLKNSHPEFEILDLGTHNTESVHYPTYANLVCEKILAHDAQLGILCCGTGIGISIAANRHKGIRAAVVHDEFTAKMAKAHNNANILCLGGRTTPFDQAKHLVETWLATKFEGDRHQIRLDLIDKTFDEVLKKS